MLGNLMKIVAAIIDVFKFTKRKAGQVRDEKEQADLERILDKPDSDK